MIEKCGLSDFDPASEFCYKGTIASLCNSNTYDLPTEFCFNSVVYPKCGGREYRPTNQKCVNSKVLTNCGGVYYDETAEFCIGGTVVSKCNDQIYDVTKQRCVNGRIQSKCGSEYYYEDDQFCSNGKLYGKCGGKVYDVSNQKCVGGRIQSKCGSTYYYPDEKFCVDGTLYSICGNSGVYDPKTEFCYNKIVYPLCGGATYNPDKKFCYNSSTYDLCDSRPYTPHPGGGCTKGSYYFSKGSYSYFEDVRDGHVYTYRSVKGVYWMVDFLKYNISSTQTVCPNASDAMCESRGRIYNWAAAMDSAGVFSNDGRGCGYGKKCSPNGIVRGACPSGWRLPTADEVTKAANTNFLVQRGPGHSSPPYTGSCGLACSYIWTSTEYDASIAGASATTEYYLYGGQRKMQKSYGYGVLCIRTF